MKSKGTAAVLALFLGALGAHKFYLGRTGMGVLYLIFCWTFIPAVVAFVEFVILLLMGEDEFNRKYNTAFALAGVQPQNIVVNVANTATNGTSGDRVGKLRELHDLHTAGALSAEQFEAEKTRLLA